MVALTKTVYIVEGDNPVNTVDLLIVTERLLIFVSPFLISAHSCCISLTSYPVTSQVSLSTVTDLQETAIDEVFVVIALTFVGAVDGA